MRLVATSLLVCSAAMVGCARSAVESGLLIYNKPPQRGKLSDQTFDAKTIFLTVVPEGTPDDDEDTQIEVESGRLGWGEDGGDELRQRALAKAARERSGRVKQLEGFQFLKRPFMYELTGIQFAALLDALDEAGLEEVPQEPPQVELESSDAFILIETGDTRRVFRKPEPEVLLREGYSPEEGRAIGLAWQASVQVLFRALGY